MSIRVNNLTHIYSEGLPYESVALDDVSFEIHSGEIIGIIGHTGSGKSTLLQHLNGLIKPKSGQIFIGDTEITKPGVLMRDIRKKVGLVFQYPEYQLFEETVAKDVIFGPINLGLSEEEAVIRARKALELVELDYDDIQNRSPFELSGGQKRRVAIAGVIAMKPEILIMDEPVAGLDPKTHKTLLNTIRRIHEEQNNILIIVSHNMADMANIADRIFVMDKGKLVMEGTPRQIFKNRERLTDIGLNIPPVAEILHKVKDALGAAELNADVLNSKEACEELIRFYKERKGV